MSAIPPQGVTMEILREVADRHIQEGRGRHIATIDQRGLSFLAPKHYANIQIGLPPDDETHNEQRVFFRAVF